MIRFFALTVLVLSSAAFSDGVVRIVLPSGDSGYSVTCENSTNVNKCYEMASDVCIYGYKIQSNETTNGVVTETNSKEYQASHGSRTTDVTSSSTSTVTTSNKGLLIHCNRDAEIQGAKAAQAAEQQRLKDEETRKAVAEFDRHWVAYTLGMAAALAVVLGLYFAFK